MHHTTKWPGQEPQPRVSEHTAVLICRGWSPSARWRPRGGYLSSTRHGGAAARRSSSAMLGEEQVSLGMGGGHTQFHSKAASWEVPSVNPARGGPAAALGVLLFVRPCDSSRALYVPFPLRHIPEPSLFSGVAGSSAREPTALARHGPTRARKCASFSQPGAHMGSCGPVVLSFCHGPRSVN